MRLKRVISGGQNGGDLAGVKAAKAAGFEVGGTMPAGYKTLDGPKPEYAELYGMAEHKTAAYPPRTFQNVRDSDGTVRFAQFIESSGEKCTLKAILQYKKPYFDVHVKDTADFTVSEPMHPQAVADWIERENIETLNVAGNSEQTSPGIGAWVERFLEAVFRLLKEKEGQPPIAQ